MKDSAPALPPPPVTAWPRVFLLTARGREATLRATLAAWARTDWPGAAAGTDAETPRVVVDPAAGGDPQQRIVTAWLGMLRLAVETAPDAPGLLLLEDDVDFAPHLAAALGRWAPWREGQIATFASLYHPGCATDPAPFPRTLAAAPERVKGAQALLIRLPFARWALKHWPTHGGMQSARLAALSAQYAPGAPIYYHTPSLVEHTGVHSAWGAAYHRAVDFDAGTAS